MARLNDFVSAKVIFMKCASLLLLPMLVFGCQMPTVHAQESVPLHEVYERVHRSVVTLRTTGRNVLPDAPTQFTSVSGIGSGVVCSADGEILTAAHVVQAADEVLVEFPTGEIVRAEVLSSVPAADVALLRIVGPPPRDMQVAEIADSDEARVGQQVFVVGAPLGISHTLTVGHLSARRDRTVASSELHDAEFFQTDAAINHGNSGGPMFNMQGKVIGIVSHIISRSGGSQGLGFAVTSNVARRLVIEGRPFWTGTHGVFIQGHQAEILNTPGGRSGFLVERVAHDSFAELIGLRGGDVLANMFGQVILLGGDIVLEIQAIAVESENRTRIREALSKTEVGSEIKLVVLRAGQLVELTMQVKAPAP